MVSADKISEVFGSSPGCAREGPLCQMRGLPVAAAAAGSPAANLEEGGVSAERWERFNGGAGKCYWYHNDDDWFWEDDPHWEQFSHGGRYWWWHAATGRHFFDDQGASSVDAAARDSSPSLATATVTAPKPSGPQDAARPINEGQPLRVSHQRRRRLSRR